ncbi:hypothetical protein [Pseudoalteromonas phenolica]|uniref:hypothetical protein n=1 Tax=Pseudoalteromonas phenolica TaxID=161398 RepID=UPI000FFF61D2|nr:hypothetical protein [Pseudoalteromonas phenolica]RXF01536.1 hypothetical protein D9981_08895 [Pseudoalteromonas phenolica O-BC30]
MKLNKLTLIVMLPLVLSACIKSKKYQEVYTEECNVPYKVVKSRPIPPEHLTDFNPKDIIIHGAALALAQMLEVSSDSIQQQTYYEEFKKSLRRTGSNDKSETDRKTCLFKQKTLISQRNKLKL